MFYTIIQDNAKISFYNSILFNSLSSASALTESNNVEKIAIYADQLIKIFCLLGHKVFNATFNNRGFSYYNLKQYPLALKDINKSLVLDSDNILALL